MRAFDLARKETFPRTGEMSRLDTSFVVRILLVDSSIEARGCWHLFRDVESSRRLASLGARADSDLKFCRSLEREVMTDVDSVRELTCVTARWLMSDAVEIDDRATFRAALTDLALASVVRARLVFSRSVLLLTVLAEIEAIDSSDF